MHNSLGKFLRRVEPGVLISIVKTVESNAGRFARGKVLADGETIEDALLPLDALEVFEGSLDALTPRQRRLFSQRAAVEAEIKARKAATGKFLREDNPHATAYAQVRDRYVEHLRTARELQARRDRAVGREREQLIAQLQEMRSSDVEFSQEYAQTKARYEAWNAANPVPTGPAAAAIRALEKKLAEIESELSEQPEG
jgi:flagellar biosynthesis GTPase FlhF